MSCPNNCPENQNNTSATVDTSQHCPPEAKRFFLLIITFLVLIFIAVLYK